GGAVGAPAASGPVTKGPRTSGLGPMLSVLVGGPVDQPFDDAAAAQVAVDDLGGVLATHADIPDGLGVDHQGWSLEAQAQATGRGDGDPAPEVGVTAQLFLQRG